MRGPRGRRALHVSGIGLGTMLCFMLVSLFGAGFPHRLRAEITNRIVAIVNTDIITLHELNTSIKRITGLNAEELRVEDEERFYEAGRAVLDSLINDKITKQQITRLGIEIAQRDIDEAIEKVKRENNLTQEELIYTLRQEGITLEEYRESLKREIERFKLVNYEVKSKIVVTEEEVRNYYQSHVMEHTELPQIRLARIFLKVRDPNDKEEIEQRKNLGADILKRLREGEDFCTLARIYSQGPAASEGGDLGWIRVSQLEPLLRKKIANLFPGEYTELEFAGSGFQIIRLVERQQGGEKPFERVRDAIHSKLFREKVEKRYASWLTRLRDESFIKIKF